MLSIYKLLKLLFILTIDNSFGSDIGLNFSSNYSKLLLQSNLKINSNYAILSENEVMITKGMYFAIIVSKLNYPSKIDIRIQRSIHRKFCRLYLTTNMNIHKNIISSNIIKKIYPLLVF